MLIAAGAHAKVVSARLGHSQIGITMNLYGHVEPGLDRAVADGFADMLRNATPPKGVQTGYKSDKKAPRR